VAAIATLWFATAAVWEMFGSFGAGHLAAGPAYMVGAENMLRWRTFGPAPFAYLLRPPLPSEYYCHHPFGLFWLMALGKLAFGHHPWVVRLPAVVMSACMPPLIYGAGRRQWGPVAGASACAVFVTVPLALAFNDLSNLEVPTMFGIAVACWGYQRFCVGFRRRDLALSVVGLAFAVNIDWPGVLFAAAWLGLMFLRGLPLARLFPATDVRRFWQWWVLALLAVTLVVAGTLSFFAATDNFTDFLNQGQRRSAGSQLPLWHVLSERRYWIDISFTPLGVWLGKWLVPLVALRAFLLRRDAEFATLAILFASIVHYVVFKNGADIHIFWPQYFALYLAFAVGSLIATIQSAAAWIFLKLRNFAWLQRVAIQSAAPWLSLALGVSLPLTFAHDAWAALVYCRLTGGRFDQRGALIHPDKDKAAFVTWLSPRLDATSGAVMASDMKQSLWFSWTLQHPVHTVSAGALPAPSRLERYQLLDTRFSDPNELAKLAQSYSVTAVGPFWSIDRLAPHAALVGYAIDRRTPNFLERFFVSGVHDLRSITSNPYVTWEYRDQFTHDPNLPPTTPPSSSEDYRVLHNLLAARGDSVAAEGALSAALAGADRSVATEFSDGSALLAMRFEHHASRVLTLYFRAGAPHSGCEFSVTSRVLKRMPLSLVPLDPKVRDVGLPSAIAHSAWKAGFVYSMVTEILKRPGSESFQGNWLGPSAPQSLSRQMPIHLLTLE
jgi:4-amino-4-deoxy-L-arabinose transferase-like glycosyltransferase